MRCILLHCVNKRKRGGLTHSQIFELTSSIPPTLKTDLPSKKRGGAFLLIGFMALGGFVVERGFIAEGRV